MARMICHGCNEEHEDFGWILKDYETEEGKASGWFCRKHFKPTKHEWVPDKIKEDRKWNLKSGIQPTRKGEWSKEFIDIYGTEHLDITEKEAKKAKNVWKDLPNYSNLKKTQ